MPSRGPSRAMSMDEGVFYVSRGNPADKSQNSAVAMAASLHSSRSFQAFRQCSCSTNGYTFIDGFQSRLVTACAGRALLHVYAHGKEAPELRCPVPEELACLASCNHPQSGKPWLLVGASKAGKLYIWELASGLLLAVKEIHYQAVTVLRFTANGEFLVSASADARVAVWKTFDLVAGHDDARGLKPYAVFTQHTLPVTDVALTNGVASDTKIYTTSEDCTVRCFDLNTRTLLSTFIAPEPVHCIALDAAERSFYIGLASGAIRTVPLYVVDPASRVLAKVGGNAKMVTLPADPDLSSSFVHHQGSTVTALALSVDGSHLVSGDAAGMVYVSDVVTRQNVKKMKELPFAITGLYSFLHHDKAPAHDYTFPVLKRVLASDQDLARHDVYMRPSAQDADATGFDFKQFLDSTREQELVFANFSDVNSAVTTAPVRHANGSSAPADPAAGPAPGSSAEDKAKIAQLEAKVLQLTKGYYDLRELHEALFKEHNDLLSTTSK